MVPGKLQSRAEPEADLSALLAVRQQLPHCGIWVVKSKRIAIVVYSSVRYSEWQLPDYLCPPAGMECSHSRIRAGSDLSTSSKRSKSASALRSTQRSSYLYAARDAHYSIHWPCRSRKRGWPHHSHTTPSLSASFMYSYAGCPRRTGAIPWLRASAQEMRPFPLSSYISSALLLSSSSGVGTGVAVWAGASCTIISVDVQPDKMLSSASRSLSSIVRSYLFELRLRGLRTNSDSSREPTLLRPYHSSVSG